MSLFLFLSLVAHSALANPPLKTPPTPPTSALTQVDFQSTVGVLLDEIPSSLWPHVETSLQQIGEPWWLQRAQYQVAMTGYRLTYRQSYYDDLKFQLNLPDKTQWEIEFRTSPAITSFQGHHLVTRNYQFTTYILSTPSSINRSEPALGEIGGEWYENFTLPVDPELLLQRTGFACVDEDQYPPGVAEAEKMDYMFDDTCDVEASIPIGPLGCLQCHCTEPLPTLSCVDALEQRVGALKVNFHYTRIPFCPAQADQIRALTPAATQNGADLAPYHADLADNRVLYRYFPNGSCEVNIDESCIAALGWRRLLYFDATDRNYGALDVDLETTDFVDNGLLSTPPTQTIAHGLFEYSSCHHHYHFRHYGLFSFLSSSGVKGATSKRGFCLGSVARWANAEWSPTWSPFSFCQTQGITSGWSDTYQAGISCQWIDITTSPSSVKGVLSSDTNFDGLLCEGKPLFYPNGSQIYVPTSFTTLTGGSVSKQACQLLPNYAANNNDSANVTVPAAGQSYVTQPCIRVRQPIGPLRDCEFQSLPDLLQTCVAGHSKTLTCSIASTPPGQTFQVLRVCESSRQLGTGTACAYRDALANVILVPNHSTLINFTCPSFRDSVEMGGVFSLYTAAVYGGDQINTVNCS